MAMSGPAAGVAAAACLARALGLGTRLAFDMGGTTTDVCLIADGAAETPSQRRLGDYPVRLPMVAWSRSARAAARSRASTARARSRWGRESAGALPGPACYGQGGTRADRDRRQPGARLPPGRRALRRGDPPRSRPRAGAALEPVAAGARALAARGGARHRGGGQREHAARAAPGVGAARLRPARVRARSPTAAPGPIHAGALAQEPACAAWSCPRTPARSPRSAAVSPLRYDAVQTYRARSTAGTAGVEDRFRALEAQCARRCSTRATARARSRVRAERRPALRRPELRDRGARGPATSTALRGGVRGAAPPALRLRDGRERRVREPARGPRRGRGRGRAAAASGPPTGTRRGRRGARAYFPETGRDRAARVPARGSCPPGVRPGPALIEDEWSTTLVYPGQRGRADRAGNL